METFEIIWSWVRIPRPHIASYEDAALAVQPTQHWSSTLDSNQKLADFKSAHSAVGVLEDWYSLRDSNPQQERFELSASASCAKGA